MSGSVGILVVGSNQTSQLLFSVHQFDVIDLISSEVQSQFEQSSAQFIPSLFSLGRLSTVSFVISFGSPLHKG